MVENKDPLELAPSGLQHMEGAILPLLDANLQGLRNSEIAELQGLRSSLTGRLKDYLTYSVLGGLILRGKVDRDDETRLFTAIDQ